MERDHLGYEIIEIHDWYDRPVLYTCAEAGVLYLVVYIDRTTEGELWFYVPLSAPRYARIVAGRIDLHDAFKKAEQNLVYAVTIGERTFSKTAIDARSISEDHLPTPGAFLHGEAYDGPPA